MDDVVVAAVGVVVVVVAAAGKDDRDRHDDDDVRGSCPVRVVVDMPMMQRILEILASSDSDRPRRFQDVDGESSLPCCGLWYRGDLSW